MASTCDIPLQRTIKAAIDRWPHRSHLDDGDIDAFAASLAENMPSELQLRLHEASALGPMDMGVVLATAQQGYHPHEAPEDVQAAKRLKAPPAPLSPRQARLHALLPAIRAQFRSRHLSAGGKVDETAHDRLQMVNHATSPHMGTSVHEIVTDPDGTRVLVRYDAPDAAPSGSGIALHHQAELHHDMLIARSLGEKIERLRLVRLDYRAWTLQVDSMSPDEDLAARLLAQAGSFWEKTVLGNEQLHAPEDPIAHLEQALQSNPDSPGLARKVSELALEFAGWSLAESEARHQRERLQDELAQALPPSHLPMSVSRLDPGPARLRIDREFDTDILVEQATQALVEKGYTREQAQEFMAQPNLRTSNEFSARELAELMVHHLGVDPATDPRFSAALVKPSAPSAPALCEFLENLDPASRQTRLARALVSSSVRMEAHRMPMAGPLAADASTMREHLRAALRAPIEAASKDVASIRTQANAAKATKRTRTSRKKQP